MDRKAWRSQYHAFQVKSEEDVVQIKTASQRNGLNQMLRWKNILPYCMLAPALFVIIIFKIIPIISVVIRSRWEFLNENLCNPISGQNVLEFIGNDIEDEFGHDTDAGDSVIYPGADCQYAIKGDCHISDHFLSSGYHGDFGCIHYMGHDGKLQ